MFDERYNRNRRNNNYEQRVSEVQTSKYFWKDRLIRPNWFRILFLVTAGIITAFVTWGVSISIFPDTLISSLLTIAAFVSISILMQPQVLNRIKGVLPKVDDATVLEAEIMKGVRTFFYKDVETGEVRDEVLFVEWDGNLSAFGMFKIDTIPLGITGEFKHFVRAIYGQKIPLFWNYVQAPLTEKEVTHLSNVSTDVRRQLIDLGNDARDNYLLNQEGVWEAAIVFGTSASQRIGINAIETMKQIYETITDRLRELRAAFFTNFPHSKLKLLQGKDIISATHVQLTNGGVFRFF